jgi:hypothetical protein
MNCARPVQTVEDPAGFSEPWMVLHLYAARQDWKTTGGSLHNSLQAQRFHQDFLFFLRHLLLLLDIFIFLIYNRYY